MSRINESLEKAAESFFGWKNICKENHSTCSNFVHTHDFSDIENDFRKNIDKKFSEFKCDCGDKVNENELKLVDESWGIHMGENAHAFRSTFFCSKCHGSCQFYKEINIHDMLNNKT